MSESLAGGWLEAGHHRVWAHGYGQDRADGCFTAQRENRGEPPQM